MRGTKIRGVTAEDLGDAAEPERLNIVAHQRARLCAVVDEQCELRTTRHRLDAERAGAGKQVEYPCILDRIVIGVHQDIEDGFAQAIRRRANVTRRRRRQAAALQSSSDHPHPLVSRLQIALPVIAALGAAWRTIAAGLLLVSRAGLFAARALHQHAAALAVRDQRALAGRLERLLAARRLIGFAAFTL